MSNLELVLYTVVAMTLIFCVIVLCAIKRYGRPIRKYDGFLDVSANDTSQIHRLDITTDPENLKDQKRVVFKVRKVLD